jgi:hypothetical protein
MSPIGPSRHFAAPQLRFMSKADPGIVHRTVDEAVVAGGDAEARTPRAMDRRSSHSAALRAAVCRASQSRRGRYVAIRTFTRELTMPQKTARENEIARENGPPHGNDDMAVLRDDELDAITGGVGKTIGGKAKIIDGRFNISAGLVLASH